MRDGVDAPLQQNLSPKILNKKKKYTENVQNVINIYERKKDDLILPQQKCVFECINVYKIYVLKMESKQDDRNNKLF